MTDPLLIEMFPDNWREVEACVQKLKAARSGFAEGIEGDAFFVTCLFQTLFDVINDHKGHHIERIALVQLIWAQMTNAWEGVRSAALQRVVREKEEN